MATASIEFIASGAPVGQAQLRLYMIQQFHAARIEAADPLLGDRAETFSPLRASELVFQVHHVLNLPPAEDMTENGSLSVRVACAAFGDAVTSKTVRFSRSAVWDQTLVLRRSPASLGALTAALAATSALGVPACVDPPFPSLLQHVSRARVLGYAPPLSAAASSSVSFSAASQAPSPAIASPAAAASADSANNADSADGADAAADPPPSASAYDDEDRARQAALAAEDAVDSAASPPLQCGESDHHVRFDVLHDSKRVAACAVLDLAALVPLHQYQLVLCLSATAAQPSPAYLVVGVTMRPVTHTVQRALDVLPGLSRVQLTLKSLKQSLDSEVVFCCYATADADALARRIRASRGQWPTLPHTRTVSLAAASSPALSPAAAGLVAPSALASVFAQAPDAAAIAANVLDARARLSPCFTLREFSRLAHTFDLYPNDDVTYGGGGSGGANDSAALVVEMFVRDSQRVPATIDGAHC